MKVAKMYADIQTENCREFKPFSNDNAVMAKCGVAPIDYTPVTANFKTLNKE